MPVVDMEGVLSEQPESTHACFGWIDGTLYLGGTHHALIISELIQKGVYTWESIMQAKQMWGWYSIDDPTGGYGETEYYDWNSGTYKERSEDSIPWRGDIEFATDDAKQSYGVKAKVKASFQDAYPWARSWTIQKGTGSTTQENYGQRARRQYLGEEESEDDEDIVPYN